jgi:hypothetical protein
MPVFPKTGSRWLALEPKPSRCIAPIAISYLYQIAQFGAIAQEGKWSVREGVGRRP